MVPRGVWNNKEKSKNLAWDGWPHRDGARRPWRMAVRKKTARWWLRQNWTAWASQSATHGCGEAICESNWAEMAQSRWISDSAWGCDGGAEKEVRRRQRPALCLKKRGRAYQFDHRCFELATRLIARQGSRNAQRATPTSVNRGREGDGIDTVHTNKLYSSLYFSHMRSATQLAPLNKVIHLDEMSNIALRIKF